MHQARNASNWHSEILYLTDLIVRPALRSHITFREMLLQHCFFAVTYIFDIIHYLQSRVSNLCCDMDDRPLY